MYDYETVLVLHADLGESAVKEMLDRVRTILESAGSELKKIDEWGMRELAYEIRRQNRGVYALFEYRAEPATVRELERQLRLSDSVLRFVTVRQVKTKTPPPPRRSREESVERRDTGGSAA